MSYIATPGKPSIARRIVAVVTALIAALVLFVTGIAVGSPPAETAEKEPAPVVDTVEPVAKTPPDLSDELEDAEVAAAELRSHRDAVLEEQQALEQRLTAAETGAETAEAAAQALRSDLSAMTEQRDVALASVAAESARADANREAMGAAEAQAEEAAADADAAREVAADAEAAQAAAEDAQLATDEADLYDDSEPVIISGFYENCDAARAAGADPVYEGEPGYGPHLDADGDGVGCE